MSEWRLVPVEPDENMIWAGDEAAQTCVKDDPCGKAGRHVWADMLKASPCSGIWPFTGAMSEPTPAPSPSPVVEVSEEMVQAALDALPFTNRPDAYDMRAALVAALRVR